MKRDVPLWQFAGFAFTSLGGTVLHYLYEWSGESVLLAPFSGVNESVWEHMKLLYFPLFVFALIQSRFFGDYEQFWCVKLRGIALGLLLIPVIFYTYNGAFGRSPDWLNIAIFFIAAAIVFLYETRSMQQDMTHCPKGAALLIICLIGVLFVVFTFATPHLPLFKDPVNGTFGLSS